ncbi:MAG: hypothetical protein SH856_03820 [Flavobacteriales bacterium]|nr:hypothetical protein [Flavobacteriales bacterium]
MKTTLTLLTLLIFAACASRDEVVSHNESPEVLGKGSQVSQPKEVKATADKVSTSDAVPSCETGKTTPTSESAEIINQHTEQAITESSSVSRAPLSQFPECMHDSYADYQARPHMPSSGYSSQPARSLQILEEVNSLSCKLGDLDDQFFELAPEGSATIPLHQYSKYGSLMAYHQDVNMKIKKLDVELEDLMLQMKYASNKDGCSTPYLHITKNDIEFSTFGVLDFIVEFPSGKASKEDIILTTDMIEPLARLTKMIQGFRENEGLNSRYDFEILYSFYGYADKQGVRNSNTISMLATEFNDPGLLTASSEHLNQKLSELRALATSAFVAEQLDEMGLTKNLQVSTCHTQGKQCEAPYSGLESGDMLDNHTRRICKVMCMIVAHPKAELVSN